MSFKGSSLSNPVRERVDYDIFISYSRRDKEFVHQLWEALTQANQTVWVDWNDIPPAEDWRQEIYRGIEAANNFIFVLSPHSIASVVCGEELTHAIQHGKRLVPIVYQDVDYENVHSELARLNWIFFRESDNFNSAVSKLIEAIEIDLNYVRSHTRLLVRAREWETTNYDSSFLLRGSDLELAEQWLVQGTNEQPQPTALQRNYIQASRIAETERQQVELRLRRMTPQQARNRQALINKVKNYWIQGVLETSQHDRMLIELSLEERSDAVAIPWNVELKTADEANKNLPSDTKVLSIFDALGEGRTLLILGEPGAGKTTTLLQLTRDLINRAEEGIDYRIPVVFNLSSWRGETQAIADWLVEELNAKYQVPKQVGKAWVQEQQLLFLLDALDEVNAEDREACVTALNDFHQNYGPELVVTSRIQDYECLSNKLNFQQAIYLKLLSSKQIYKALDNKDSYLVGLKNLLLKDESLCQLAKSPLMLHIMTMAYQGIAIQDLQETGFIEERRTQLFNAYIEQMFKHRGINQQYSNVQTLHWLNWLAQRMTQFCQTVFMIEEIQPNWLQTESQKRAYRIGVKLLLGAIWGGLHVGLLAGYEPGNIITFDLRHNLQGLMFGVIGGVLYGVIGGLLWGLLHESSNHFKARLVNALLLGGIFGPIFGWIYRDWVYAGVYAIIYGVVGLIIYNPLHFKQTIEPIETLKWSWRKALSYSIVGLLIGIIIKMGTPVTLLPSLIFGLILLLIFGFEKARDVEQKTRPNQKIWQSVANTVKLFLVIGLFTGVILGILENPMFGFVNGLLLGVAAAVLGGQGAGIVCIKHFTLRCILWRSGYIPWNYARFLDYASDRVFLQKVGGGYVFIHRLLLEHFAQIQL